MLKLFGAAVICFCGYSAGYIKAAGIRKRLKILTEILRGIPTLKKSMVFEKRPLKSALYELSGLALTGRAFSDTAENMRAEGVESAWKKAVRAYMPELSEEDADAVEFLCRGMGMSDAAGEEEHLEAARTLIGERAYAVRREYEEKSGLYKKFGILAAVFVALVMI